MWGRKIAQRTSITNQKSLSTQFRWSQKSTQGKQLHNIDILWWELKAKLSSSKSECLKSRNSFLQSHSEYRWILQLSFADSKTTTEKKLIVFLIKCSQWKWIFSLICCILPSLFAFLCFPTKTIWESVHPTSLRKCAKEVPHSQSKWTHSLFSFMWRNQKWILFFQCMNKCFCFIV